MFRNVELITRFVPSERRASALLRLTQPDPTAASPWRCSSSQHRSCSQTQRIAAAGSLPTLVIGLPQRSAIKHIIIKILLCGKDSPLSPPPRQPLKPPPEETRRDNYSRHQRPVVAGQPHFNTRQRRRTIRRQPSGRVRLAVNEAPERPELSATKGIAAR